MRRADRPPHCNHAFTLVELLVVIGIIALLVGILLPTLSSAQRSARDVKCQSNIRQLCMSLVNYAQDYKGKFPPNVNAGGFGGNPAQPTTEQVWFHEDRIGRYLPKTLITPGTNNVATPVMVCPDDQEPAARSYAMNIWASSAVDTGVKNSGRGELWTSGTKGSSKLILVSEKWSGNGPSLGYYFANATIGYQGDKAGKRFGAGGGIPGLSNGRFGNTITEIDYTRHRRRTDGGRGTEPIGRINIGFADGHVASFSNNDLADFKDPAGKSRLVAWWSPKDPQMR